MSNIISNVLVCGGSDGREAVREIESYNITDDHWMLLSIRLTVSLPKCDCFTLNGKNILIIGGRFNEGRELKGEGFLLDTEFCSFKQIGGLKEAGGFNFIGCYDQELFLFGVK